MHRSFSPIALCFAVAAVCGAFGCRRDVALPSEAEGPAMTPGPETTEPSFVDRAAELSLRFDHWNGMTGRYRFPEVVGAGAAVFDVDGDGDLDLYLVQGAALAPAEMAEALFPPPETPPRDRLFLNRLIEDGALRFVDVTDEWRLAETGYGVAAAAGDIDSDGDLDLYLAQLGGNRLLRNDGAHFTDVTAAAGADDPRWSAAATFFDYDRDGDLDLFVGNYVEWSLGLDKACFTESGARDYCSPLSYQPVPDRLLRNRGDGSFEDVSVEARIVKAFGGALGVIAADFDGDGWLDLYVANDGVANQLWRNLGADAGGVVRFEDVALIAGAAYNEDGKSEASMGVDAGDVDGDGDLDIFMTHLFDETNTLYLNRGDALFEDMSFESGLGSVSRASTGFGTAFFDANGDGHLDILAVNGAVRMGEKAGTGVFPLDETNQLFLGSGDGSFVDATSQAGPAFAVSRVSRGAAFGDLDNDGDVDVVVSNDGGAVELLINEPRNPVDWLGLRLLTQGRDAYGATIRAELDNGRQLYRRVRADGSFASSHDPRILIGLDGCAVIGLEVQWPSGYRERFDTADLRGGTYQTLVEGSGGGAG